MISGPGMQEPYIAVRSPAIFVSANTIPHMPVTQIGAIAFCKNRDFQREAASVAPALDDLNTPVNGTSLRSDLAGIAKKGCIPWNELASHKSKSPSSG